MTSDVLQVVSAPKSDDAGHNYSLPVKRNNVDGSKETPGILLAEIDTNVLDFHRDYP